MKASQFPCVLLLCVLPFFVEACANSTATPSSIDTPTPAPTDTPIPTPTNSPTPDIILIAPDVKMVDAVLTGLESNQTIAYDHVPPPPSSLNDLAVVYLALAKQELLINPCEEPCAIFNPDRATTYSLPKAAGQQIGALYQLVSLQQPSDGELSKSKEWGEKGLVIGGLLVSQPNPIILPKTDELPVGPYLVVLRRVGDELEAELWSGKYLAEPYTTVQWRLRQRQGLTWTSKMPFSFVSADELCFSQIEFQACLAAKTRTVGSVQNLDAITNAIEKLKAYNLLPPDAQVRTDAAMPGIQGSTAITRCYEKIGAEPTDCQASVVAAGMDALIEQQGESDSVISELVAGIGVLAVLTDIPDEVFDSDGKPATLRVGSYRLDLLHTARGPWLVQFVQAGSLQPFYLYAIEVYVQGELVNPDPDTDLLFKPLDDSEFSSEVLLGTYYVKLCQSSKVTSTKCKQADKWKRDWCITEGNPGWCDVVGY